MDSFRSSPRCRNGAVYGTRVGRKIGCPGEVARQADTAASKRGVHTHTEHRPGRAGRVGHEVHPLASPAVPMMCVPVKQAAFTGDATDGVGGSGQEDL
ncbi:uncharacterized protein N7518_009015 [Penicillium psychrosexuale]|uniref:uncharacterized protein n=1 Tax=Penicillium psychrosexuale TaxID=1002107 RepID=UPI002545B2F4|nr:uncharacterized protein N7518_009015 [Penicillium psychrosexuale]KAJ5783338.1 hypothetical protein N7518_009015 [Penicillium psychrosexuale]